MEQAAIQKVEAAAPALQWTADQIETIRKTVAKDASNEELNMFLHLSEAYGLDPFAKDIWFIKYDKSSPTIFTSRDGYLKIANRDPNYEGMDSDVVYSGDKFNKTKAGVEHTYGLRDRGTPEGAYAIVYRKDRKYPTYVYAPFKDYNRGGTWGKYPHAMILKVAEAMALKRAFSISGLVTREELDLEAADRPKERKPMTAEAIAEVAKHLYNGYLKACGNAEQAKEAMLRAVPGKVSSKDYTEEDLYALRRDLFEREARAAQEAPVDAEYTETAGVIVPEMVVPDPKAELAAEITKVMELLDWRSDEAAVFFGRHGGGARLEDMTQEQLYNVLKAARAELKKRDTEGR